MNPVAPVRKTFMVRDQFTTDGWRLRNRLQYQQFLCSMALPELFIRRDLALLHRLRALAVEVGLPALVQHRTIAGMKGQIVAIPDSIECIEEIEAVFIRFYGDRIDLFMGRQNESGDIGIENLRVSVLLGFEQRLGAAGFQKRILVDIDNAFVTYFKSIDNGWTDAAIADYLSKKWLARCVKLGPGNRQQRHRAGHNQLLILLHHLLHALAVLDGDHQRHHRDKNDTDGNDPVQPGDSALMFMAVAV